VDGVEGSEIHGLERPRADQDAVVEAYQIDSGEHPSTGSQRRGPSAEEGSKDLGPGQGARNQRPPASKVSAQGI